MTFLTKTSKMTEDSYKILDFPDSDVLQRQQSRRKTDKIFLFVFAISIAILLPFLVNTFCYSDINRLKGYDSCGNICGQMNVKYDLWDCTGQDMTLKPIIGQDGQCHSLSDDYHYHRDIEEDMFYLNYSAIWKVTLLFFIPIALCLIFVVLFRYCPAVAVCIISVGVWSIFATLGMGLLRICDLWYDVPLFIFCVILILILCIYIHVNFNQIRHLTVLLKEATRPLFEINMMSIVPFGALCSLIVIVLLHSVANFQIAAYGRLTEIKSVTEYVADDMEYGSHKLDYVYDNLMPATITLNVIIAFWVIMFILGVQYTTVSGVVTQWYTTNDQDNLNDSVCSNLRATVKYHLGTVALGSVMMTIMFIPRLILQFFAMFSALKQKADSWLRYLDGFFTTNSYIITAKYGTSFGQSGKKAENLLNLSIGDTRDLNTSVNSVIQTTQYLIVFVSTLAVFIAVQYNYVYAVVFQFAISCVCVHTILGTIKVSTNTLFLCATEELLGDKETNLPLTLIMKEAVDGSNKLLLQKIQNRPPSKIPGNSFCIIMFLFIFVVITCVLFVVACFI